MSVNDEDVARDPWRGVYQALRNAIVSGEYPPGSRLVEQQLADRFRTSRGPVRTALHELERSGLVTSVDRRGTFVREISDTDIEEIDSLWKVLFEFAVRRAVERMTPEDRAWLEDFRSRAPVITDPDAFLEYGIELTRKVFVMANHSRAKEIYESLLIQAQARSIFFTSVSGSDGSTYWFSEGGSLTDLCDALLRGDADGAVDLSNAGLAEFEASIAERRGVGPSPGA